MPLDVSDFRLALPQERYVAILDALERGHFQHVFLEDLRLLGRQLRAVIEDEDDLPAPTLLEIAASHLPADRALDRDLETPAVQQLRAQRVSRAAKRAFDALEAWAEEHAADIRPVAPQYLEGRPPFAARMTTAGHYDAWHTTLWIDLETPVAVRQWTVDRAAGTATAVYDDASGQHTRVLRLDQLGRAWEWICGGWARPQPGRRVEFVATPY